MIHLANRVQGFENEINSQQRNKIIFNSFPKTWQRNWIHAGKEINTASLQDIQTYFENQKEIMDEEVKFNTKNIKNKSSLFNPTFTNKRKRDTNNNIPSTELC